MFSILVISATALLKPYDLIDDYIPSRQYSKSTNDIQKSIQNQNLKIKEILENQTLIENLTNFPHLNNNSVKNTTKHHHHHFKSNHHGNINHNQQSKNGHFDNRDSHHLKRRLHRRNHFKHYSKPHYHDISSQVNDKVVNNNGLDDTKKISNDSKEKMINSKVRLIRDCVNIIKEQNHTKINEKKQNNVKIDQKFADELIQKYKKLKQETQHSGQKKPKFMKKLNDYQPLHQLDENQIKKLQEKLKEIDVILYKNNDSKESSNSKSNPKEILKSNYVIGGTIFVGIVLAVLMVVMIYKRTHKNEDNSTDNYHEPKEIKDNESL